MRRTKGDKEKLNRLDDKTKQQDYDKTKPPVKSRRQAGKLDWMKLLNNDLTTVLGSRANSLGLYPRFGEMRNSEVKASAE